jgi:hypothetical protein
VTIWILLALAASGLVVGFMAGLVGIGGGVLFVPLLYFFYGHPAWSGIALDPALHAVVSHATSLFVIVPTSALGTWTYHRAGAVAWRSALPIAGFSILAALVGSQLAPAIPAAVLKLGFGVLLLVFGSRMLRARSGDVAADRHPRLVVGALSGLAVGLMSALLGVGGGIVAIPILLYVMGLKLDKVAATSLAIIAFTALAAVVGYGVSGWGRADLPAGSVGFVHVFAGIPLLVGAVIAVSVGARVNQKLGNRMLRLLFGALFVLLGLRLATQHLSVLPGIG